MRALNTSKNPISVDVKSNRVIRSGLPPSIAQSHLPRIDEASSLINVCPLLGMTKATNLRSLKSSLVTVLALELFTGPADDWAALIGGAEGIGMTLFTASTGKAIPCL